MLCFCAGWSRPLLNQKMKVVLLIALFSVTSILATSVTIPFHHHDPPNPPVWPKGFNNTNEVVAFDPDSIPHPHKSIFYYSYYFYNGSYHGAERHDHFGFCYGWGNFDCTILIIGNVYIIANDSRMCCNALSGNYGVPIDWLKHATWIGRETVENKLVDHWYYAEHEYWSDATYPYEGVRYSGPNFNTPRQFTTYQPWKYGDQDSSLFQLPENVDCSGPCPN